MKNAIVLVSGGIDSATCLAIAKQQGYTCYALSIDYGQRHRSELIAAGKIARQLQAKAHKTVSISLDNIGGSALTDKAIDVPDYQPNAGITTSYVPARNTIFLSIALGWAEVVEAEAIFFGMNADDYNGFPDCRQAYIEAFENMANLATKAGVEGKKLSLQTPLKLLDKPAIIRQAEVLGVDLSLTQTCYSPTPENLACGVCESCVLRRKGFLAAGVTDPTQYA